MFSSWAGLLALSLASSSAQVTVEVTQDQQQYLEGETLPVAVRITNRSGQPLHLGAEADWLTFTIESKDGHVISRTSEVPVSGEFDLESSKVGIKRLDLAPYFTLTQPGGYAIVATVHIREWDRDVTSRPSSFDIIEGAKLWEQEIGLPQPGGGNPPEIRKYILQQANYIRGHLRLYLRVTDAYGKALRVCPIGGMVSFGHPDPPQIDKVSNLHLLYQNGPSSFSYTIFNPNGELLLRQVYDYSTSRPKLFAGSEDGEISVKGGVRRLTDNDIPPPKSEQEEQASVSAPAKTETPSSKAEPPAEPK